MRARVIGTAGHIDHGKTALVRALTGVDCDRLPEEKRRGITIDIGFASWTEGDTEISFIDVPGHERFIRNMLAGIGGIDAVLLVVAADESIKPQTREHLAICRLLHVPTGLVAITKADLVEPEILEIVRMEIEELVAGSFLEGRPVIAVSSSTGRGIPELKSALLATALEAPERDRDLRLFRLPIDRAFTVKGFGSVVTGTTISGRIRVEDEIEILPEALRSRARNIQVHGGERSEAVAGERTSINLADLPLESLHRGQQAAEPGSFQPSQIVTAVLDLLPGASSLKDQARVRFHHYSSEILATVRILQEGAAEVRGGEHVAVQFRLESPAVAVAGDRFVIRRYSPAITIGGGLVLDATLGKLSRGTRTEILSVLESGSTADRFQLLARLASLHGITLAQYSRQTGFRVDALRSELESQALPKLVRVAGDRWLHIEPIASFRKKAMAFLHAHFDRNRVAVGVARSELVQKLIPQDVDPPVIDFLLGDLVAERIITLSGDRIDVPGRSSDLSGSEGELARLLVKRFLEAGLNPPAVSEFIKTIPQRPKVIEGVIGFLVKTDRLVCLAEGIYLHPETMAAARAKLAEHRGKKVDIAWFKDLFGISRKVVIPLLELLDREGVTKREADQRLIL